QTPKGVVFTGKSSIRIWGARKIALSDFHFKEVSSQAVVTIYNSQKVEIVNNYFEKCGNNAIGAIIRLESGASENNIHNNTLEQNRAMGVVVSANPSNPSQCTNNFIHHNDFLRIPKVSEIYPNSSNGLEAIQLGQGIDDAELSLYTRVY